MSFYLLNNNYSLNNVYKVWQGNWSLHSPTSLDNVQWFLWLRKHFSLFLIICIIKLLTSCHKSGTHSQRMTLQVCSLVVLQSTDVPNRLIGQVVKASALKAEGQELWRDFSESSHNSDLKIGTAVATLPGAWHYRVSAGTGWPGVSILWLGEVESLICNFYLSVAARTIVLSRSVPEIH